MSESKILVGPADALRCAFGLLLPAFVHTVGAFTGIAAAFGLLSDRANLAAAVVAFGLTAGIEILRRVVLYTRPNGGQAATAALRAAAWSMLGAAIPIIALLAGDLATRCFGSSCGLGASDYDSVRVVLILWLAVCCLMLLTAPLLLSILRRSAWLQPRGPDT